MFLIYSLLFTLGVVLTAPYYLWRLRGHILSDAGWRERLGYLPESFQQPDSTAVSGARWVPPFPSDPVGAGEVPCCNTADGGNNRGALSSGHVAC